MAKRLAVTAKDKGNMTGKLTSPTGRHSGKSAKQNTATMSGSRPTSGRFPIPVSSPNNPRMLDSRATKSALK